MRVRCRTPWHVLEMWAGGRLPEHAATLIRLCSKLLALPPTPLPPKQIFVFSLCCRLLCCTDETRKPPPLAETPESVTHYCTPWPSLERTPWRLGLSQPSDHPAFWGCSRATLAQSPTGSQKILLLTHARLLKEESFLIKAWKCTSLFPGAPLPSRKVMKA